MNAGRSHRICIILKLLTAVAQPIVAHNQVAREQKDLLPIVMNEWISCIGAGCKAQQPRPVAALVLLVELASDDLFLDPSGVAGQGMPTVLHIEDMKFFMTFVITHGGFSSPLSC